MPNKALAIFLHQDYVGELIQDISGKIQFTYAQDYLQNPEALALSHSLPLRENTFSANECRGFFSGLLPEAEKREIIASNLGISARNDFSMLEQIGGECAGAVSFLPKGSLRTDLQYDYRTISDDQLADILRQLPKRPLLAGDQDVRLSLAGVQDKLPVAIKDSQIYLPLGGAPSTHIIKPAIDRFENLVLNESFCLQLAAKLNIPSAQASVHNADDVDYLLIKRYDRKIDAQGNLKRIHQEDFCQALNVPPTLKYQSEGGPGLTQCFDLVRATSSTPVIDLKKLLDAVIFNFLVGNNDAHGKNFSILYDHNHCSLAPLYDIVCTAFYPELSEKMAMKIDRKYKFNEVTTQHFEAFAQKAGLAPKNVLKQVLEITNSLLEVLEKTEHPNPVSQDIASLISNRCRHIINHTKP